MATYVNNAKNSFLGGFGSSPGCIFVSGSPGFEAVQRARSTIVNQWSLFETTAGGTTTVRDAVGGVNGTLVGSPTDGGFPASTSVGEGALNFGSGARMTSAAINVAAVAVEFWVKLAANPVTGANKGLLVATGIDSSSKHGMVFTLGSTGTLTCSAMYGSGTVRSATSASFPIGRWNHVVGIASTTAGILVYVNGVAGVTNQSMLSAVRTDLTSGMFVAGNGAANGYVDVPGRYNNVAVYSGATPFTAGDVATHYAFGAYQAPSGGKVTQSVVEVLRDSASRQGRVSQSLVEVLRQVATGFPYEVGASSSLLLSPAAGETVASAVNASAASSFTIGSASSEVRDAVAGASTGLAVGASCFPGVSVGVFVGAESAIGFAASAFAYPLNDRPVSAHTRLLFGMRFAGRVDPVRVSAGNTLAFAAGCDGLGVGPRPVEARTGFAFASAIVTDNDATLPVAAQTRVRFASAARARRDVVVAATSGVTIAAEATTAGRDIHVSAVTAFVLGTSEEYEPFYLLSAASSLAFGQSASVAVGGTEARSGFRFTDMATATVLFPWRFRPLPLPPGGGLPHS